MKQNRHGNLVSRIARIHANRVSPITRFLGACLLALSIPFAAQAGVAEAREKAAQFKTELAAFFEAQKTGDATAMEQHQTAAQNALEEARKLFNTAEKDLRSDSTALLEYAEILKYSGEFDRVAETLERAARLDRNNGAAWLALGDALTRLGHSRAGDAERALRHVLEMDKNSQDLARAHTMLGVLYRQEGLYDLARESFEMSLKIMPDGVTPRVALAALKARDGRMREAENDLVALGSLAAESGQPLDAVLKEALADFERNRRWIPDTAEDHLAYAKLLVRVNRIKDCLGPLERSVKLDPNNPVAWNLLGSVFRFLNDVPRAKEAFTRSLALKPDDVRTQETLQALNAPQPPTPGAETTPPPANTPNQ